ncbi:MAG: TIGR02996 domain-containing protein [Myxococcota bacterium]
MVEELRKRILDAPDDPDPWRVLGDWLQQRGDPRGEFIRVQLALEDPLIDPATRRSLQGKERALLNAHEREWLGPLGDPLFANKDQPLSARWGFRRGFLHTLDLVNAMPDVVAGLVASPDRDLLRSLSVEYAFEENEVLEPLVNVNFPSVVAFRFGDGTGSLREEGLAGVIAGGMPRLRALTVSGRRVDTKSLFSLKAPDLEELDVSCAHEHATKALAKNPSFANLERLALAPHALEPGDDESGYLPLSAVRDIARSPHLQAIGQLSLWQSSAGDAGVAELLRSGMLARLHILNLSYGTITDEGARMIAESEAPKTLQSLTLTQNRLTPDGIALVEGCGIGHVVAQNQRDEDNIWYLYHGDIE